MSLTTTIFLTTTKPSSQWQSDNLLQIVNDDIYIYLDEATLAPLQKIQKAARSIEKLGVQQATLQGEAWTFEWQWAFALGFSCVKKTANVKFTGSTETVNLLTQKMTAYAWARDLTNQTPSDLSPLLLAQQAQQYTRYDRHPILVTQAKKKIKKKTKKKQTKNKKQ